MAQLEEAHRVERAKWDAIAAGEANEARQLPPYSDILAYLRHSGRSPGMADFLGTLAGKRVLEYGCGLGKATRCWRRAART
jgi:hypothetical protein